MTVPLHYYLQVIDADGDDVAQVGGLGLLAEAFVRGHMLNVFKPLSAEQYANGPLGMLSTAARSSYVMHGDAVIWCVEWNPGLIAVRFESDRMGWAAFRDPRPDFGGRAPLPEDADEDHDEDANPLYSLVFDAWDAQFDEDCREAMQARHATVEEQARFAAAFAMVSDLPEEPSGLNKAARDQWLTRCKASIAAFASEGIRFWRT